MYLTRLEQETIITFNEEEKTANVYTHNKSLQNKLLKLAEERPQDCTLDRTSRGGQAMDFTVPKKWIKVNASLLLTDEQRAKMAERGRKLRAEQLGRDFTPNDRDERPAL